MATTIHFNTKRAYTKHGQRITATLYEDRGIVTFFDHDRMIDGEFGIVQGMENFDQRMVMSAYDAGITRSSFESFQDAFAQGGSNLIYAGPDA